MALHIENELSKTGINTKITEHNFNDAMMYTNLYEDNIPHVYVLGGYRIRVAVVTYVNTCSCCCLYEVCVLETGTSCHEYLQSEITVVIHLKTEMFLVN